MSHPHPVETDAIDNVTALVRERIGEPRRALMERFTRPYLEGVSTRSSAEITLASSWSA